MKKFTNSDIFVNRIKTYPKVKLILNNGRSYYNGENNSGNIYLQNLINDITIVQIADTCGGPILTEAGVELSTELSNVIITEQEI